MGNQTLEEFAKQETLEEFAKQEAIKQYLEDTFGNLIVRKSIEKGAKWQAERMYSEEDMKQFALKCVITYTFNKDYISDNFRIPIERNNNNQFEKFKKK